MLTHLRNFLTLSGFAEKWKMEIRFSKIGVKSDPLVVMLNTRWARRREKHKNLEKSQCLKKCQQSDQECCQLERHFILSRNPKARPQILIILNWPSSLLMFQLVHQIRLCVHNKITTFNNRQDWFHHQVKRTSIKSWDKRWVSRSRQSNQHRFKTSRSKWAPVPCKDGAFPWRMLTLTSWPWAKIKTRPFSQVIIIILGEIMAFDLIWFASLWRSRRL